MEILVGARVDGQRWALKEGLGNESCAVVWKRDISPRRYLLQHIALLGMSRKTWYSANAPISPSLGDTYKLRKGWNSGCARHWFPQSCCQDKNSILLSMLLWWKRPRMWCLYLKSHLLHSRSDRWMMSSLRSNWGTHAPIRLDLVSGFWPIAQECHTARVFDGSIVCLPRDYVSIEIWIASSLSLGHCQLCVHSNGVEPERVHTIIRTTSQVVVHQ